MRINRTYHFLLTLVLVAVEWNPTWAFLSQSLPSTTAVVQHTTVAAHINPAKRIKLRFPRASIVVKSKAPSSKEEEKSNTDDVYFDGRSTAILIGGQGILILASVAIAALIGTPNYSFGPGIAFTPTAISYGVLLTLPLGILAAALDLIEDKFPALQDVSKATQRSVLTLLGGNFKPGIGFLACLALGVVAGFGEEMLFRGLLQYELASRIGRGVAIGLSSVIFGALHAVTPLYAVLASLASIYFGALYLYFGNLAVPITAHAFYDLVALLYAHWMVSRLSKSEQAKLAAWKGPGDVRDVL